MIVTLCSGSAIGSSGNHRVPGLVIGAVHAIELAEDHRAALDAHQDLVACRFQVGVAHGGASGPGSNERRLVHQVREIRA